MEARYANAMLVMVLSTNQSVVPSDTAAFQSPLPRLISLLVSRARVDALSYAAANNVFTFANHNVVPSDVPLSQPEPLKAISLPPTRARKFTPNNNFTVACFQIVIRPCECLRTIEPVNLCRMSKQIRCSQYSRRKPHTCSHVVDCTHACLNANGRVRYG